MMTNIHQLHKDDFVGSLLNTCKFGVVQIRQKKYTQVRDFGVMDGVFS